ncbi:hypothetical protein [Streptomyces parvulus]|uniref:hypothetical protein n=1 Tax=Streptomyces parvulus TaxID=146923 RepID=UPI00367ABB8F
MGYAAMVGASHPRPHRRVLQRFHPHTVMSVAGRGRMLRWKTLVVAGVVALRWRDD